MGRHLRWLKPLPWPFQGIREVCLFLPAKGCLKQRSASPKILFLLDGQCRVSLKDSPPFDLRARDVLVLPSPCHHTYEALPGQKGVSVHCFVVFLRDDLFGTAPRRDTLKRDLQPLLEPFLAAPLLLPARIDAEQKDGLRKCWDELDRRGPGFETRVYSLLLSLIILLARRTVNSVASPLNDSRPGQHMVQTAMEFMRQSIFFRVDLGDVAANVGRSQEHLSRVFKAETGQSVMGFLRHRRIEAAKEFLVTGNDSVKVIAHRLAFANVGHFCRLFRKETGNSPLEFRRVHPGHKR